jgi:tetratricopeptide (TPR) repeat protein
MPTELTRDHAKALYEFAVSVQRARGFGYAVRLFEKLIEIADPFYTPFALNNISQCYSQLGRRDLELDAMRRIVRLPKDQQELLHPGSLSLAYQRLGNLRAARELHAEILALTPHELASVAALGEILLLEGKPIDAEPLAAELRERPEPAYQILGRMIGGLAFALRGMHDAAAKELYWVGQFLISSGNVPVGAWDYRDLQPVAEKTGRNARTLNVLMDVLNGKIALPEFIEAWKTATPAV